MVMTARLSDLRLQRALASAGALVVACLAVPSVGQASFLGTAELNYAGPPYCSNPCLNATDPSAGTVTVTVVGSDLHFDVELTTGFTFMFQSQHNTSFAFGLDVTGATISNITSSLLEVPGGSWSQQASPVPLGDGVGSSWPYGLALAASKTSDDVQFDVSKAATSLTLADLIQTDDKNGVPLWFVADVANPNGNTGFVGANSSGRIGGGGQGGETPLPAALPMMGSMLGAGYLLSIWRRRRGRSGAAAA
jgi:hypothetical protein